MSFEFGRRRRSRRRSRKGTQIVRVSRRRRSRRGSRKGRRSSRRGGKSGAKALFAQRAKKVQKIMAEGKSRKQAWKIVMAGGGNAFGAGNVKIPGF